MSDLDSLIKDMRKRAKWFRRERPWDKDEPQILDAWADELQAISDYHRNRKTGN